MEYKIARHPGGLSSWRVLHYLNKTPLYFQVNNWEEITCKFLTDYTVVCLLRKGKVQREMKLAARI